jgi:glutamyl endopeptidase
MVFRSSRRISEKELLERYRLDSEIALLEVLSHGTPRRLVSQQDTLAVPHRWICFLRTRETDPTSRRYGLGTGVLIGPRHVLTAAHVLVSEENPGITVGDRLTVQPARNGHYEPFDAVGIRGWQVHPQWIIKRGGNWSVQTQYDYGLVTLKKDISRWKHKSLGGCELAYWGALGICGARSKVGLTAAQVTGQEAQATGYPGERQKATLWTGSGRITFDSRRSVMLHTIDTSGGQSGAPIWFMQDGIPWLAGIHSRPAKAWSVDATSAMSRTHNSGVLITPDILRQLEAWKGTFAR